MRGWTEERFRRALAEQDAGDDVLWLAPRSAKAPSRRHALDRLDRLGTRVGRAALLVACGCAASGLLPGSAFAPVSHAHAALAASGLDAVDIVRADEKPPGPAVMLMPVSTDAITVHAVPALLADREASPAEASLDETIEPDGDAAESWLRFGSRSLPRRLVETILDAARTVEVDPTYLMALADKESSFRTDVKASTSSAQGLFQFIDRTWLEVVRAFGAKHGLAAEAAAITMIDERPVVADGAERTRILALRSDPAVAALMAAEMLRRDAAQIGFQVGRALTPTELYLAHFLGLEDAARFITLRNAGKVQSATAHFPAAARANAAIFFERLRRGRRGLSVPEVYARLDRMIDSRVALFRDVRDTASLASPGV